MFKKAVKGSRPFRIAIDGPSGAGKTWTALMMMSQLCDSFAVIDTERGSASLYSDKFPFDTIEPEDHSPKTYGRIIKAAEAAGYKGLVIDSLSHAWNGKDGALEQVDKAAKRSQSANTFAAWRDVTPMHNELVDTIVSAKMHIIATMRSKMEYVLETVERNGKKSQVPRKVGLAPIQRDGVEYEFDLIADMDLDHNFCVSKTRFDSLDGLVINKPGPELVVKLKEWLSTTTQVSSPVPTNTQVKEEAQPGSDPQNPNNTHPADAPANDDDLISDSKWRELMPRGEALGWSVRDIENLCMHKFSLPPEDARAITYKQAKQINGIVSKITPEKAGVRQ